MEFKIVDISKENLKCFETYNFADELREGLAEGSVMVSVGP